MILSTALPHGVKVFIFSYDIGLSFLPSLIQRRDKLSLIHITIPVTLITLQYVTIATPSRSMTAETATSTKSGKSLQEIADEFSATCQRVLSSETCSPFSTKLKATFPYMMASSKGINCSDGALSQGWVEMLGNRKFWQELERTSAWAQESEDGSADLCASAEALAEVLHGKLKSLLVISVAAGN